MIHTMEMPQLFDLILTLLFGSLGFFIKTLIEDVKDLKIRNTIVENKLDVLKNDHTNKYENLTNKIDDLKTTIIDLTKELKELNKK